MVHFSVFKSSSDIYCKTQVQSRAENFSKTQKPEDEVLHSINVLLNRALANTTLKILKPSDCMSLRNVLFVKHCLKLY